MPKMKSLTINIILFFASSFYAQSTMNYFSTSDLIITDSLVTLIPKTIFIKNGLNEFKEVKIIMVSNKEQFEKLTLETFNLIIQNANRKTKYGLKYKSSYNPTKVSVIFIAKNKEWVVSIDYTAHNDFGASKEGKSFIMFNEIGDFKSQN